MKGTVLITDSLFIFPEHEKLIREAGYDIERLDTPTASEEQLVTHIRGKVGYILGGIEKVTVNVIKAADSLKAIVFTGADVRAFVPGFELATAGRIAIANAPGANAYAVAEYTLTLILAMTRNIFELGRTGTKKFETTRSLSESTVGIIGMGNVATRLAKSLDGIGTKEILYYNRTRKPELENELGLRFVSFEELLKSSDIIVPLVSKEIGNGYIAKNELAQMKDKTLIVNTGFHGGVDLDALFEELKQSRLRAVEDYEVDEKFQTLPLSVWFNSNGHAAYNTFEANKKASDMATQSLLNLLATGKDAYRVN